MHRRDVVLAVDASDHEAPVFGLAGQAVLEDDHRGDDLGALEVGDVVALDPQRHLVEPERLLDLLEGAVAGGEVAGPLRLVEGEGLGGVVGHRLLQVALVAALRDADRDPAPPPLAEQLLQHVGVGRQGRHQHLARDRVVLAAVELEEEVLHQLGRAALVGAVGDPAALAADATAAHVEDLHGDLERVLDERDHVGVGAVAQHHGLLLQRLGERAEVVAEPGGLLEVQRLGGGVHLPLDALGEGGRVAGHEVAEVVDDLAVLLGRHVADARGRALVDVAQQAGATDLGRALEDAVAARAHREDAQQQVDGLADGPGVAVGAEVAGALALGAATDHHARELLADGHRQPGVGLVVAVLDVEARVELLDPAVLQLQGLDLGVDDGPLHARAGGDHGRRARVEVADVLEVRRQARAQALGLADVDDAALGVAEAVDPRLGRDRPGRGSIGARHGHPPTLRAAPDSLGRVGAARSCVSPGGLRPG